MLIEVHETIIPKMLSWLGATPALYLCVPLSVWPP